MLLVRHSLPEVDAGVPSEEWRLSDEGNPRGQLELWKSLELPDVVEV